MFTSSEYLLYQVPVPEYLPNELVTRAHDAQWAAHPVIAG
jgi:hypothetical protein